MVFSSGKWGGNRGDDWDAFQPHQCRTEWHPIPSGDKWWEKQPQPVTLGPWMQWPTVFHCSQEEFSPEPQMSNQQLTKWGRDQLPLDYYNVSSKPAFGGLWVPISYCHHGVLSILLLPGPCAWFLPLILSPSLFDSCLPQAISFPLSPLLGFFHGLLSLLVGWLGRLYPQ